MGDWAILPYDLLGEIALKLDCFDDLVYFSAVCSSWFCVYSMIKSKFSARVPFLFLAENTKNNPKFLRKLFSPNKQRCYQLALPETFGVRCWGTSSGWVVTVDLNLKLYVFNPFTGVRIRLPPLPTIPIKQSRQGDHILFKRAYINKAYVFDHYNDDFVVVALYDGLVRTKIAYARPGDEAWTLVTTDYGSCVHDVVRMGTKLLVVFLDGNVGYRDIPIFQSSQSPKISNYLPKLHLPFLMQPAYGLRRFYLLKAFGHLLLVFRHKGAWEDGPSYGTIKFGVYLFNFDTNKWEMVEDLGDVSLFVGNNCSLAVNGCAKNNLKSNCIYFTDDETMMWELPMSLGGDDMGIYHLKNMLFEPLFYEGDDIHSLFCPPFWFVPSYSC